MNIFLPYENDIIKSVRSLDDRRLNKQALECYQLLTNAIRESNGEKINGYKNHPIYVHYKGSIKFLAYYGWECCLEYWYRFEKEHKLEHFFVMKAQDARHPYTPFYMEGSKDSPNCIRTTDNVSELYRKKLCNKWDTDKANGRPPRWTNRGIPSFYKGVKNAK